ncbi:chemotaxis protein cheY [Asticcacaulis biprosthecium C19]|uniref:Chemotaxis protein cheY n=1 Tax=Asticcacaulis biprosthecium C19 TaxID=715226 RepID=F4QMW4_9CAUL|nr:response regulator [Asticcacaulis biprosthecium]EGF91555.1 chemotaxis protein cheY [Asticcacaulis biprosthecium C19]
MATAHSQTQKWLRKIDCESVGILIVEDNDASRRLVQELLRATGFVKLHYARSAEEAVEQIHAHHPDLILMDWELPGKSGIDLVREIRQAAHSEKPEFPNPQVPIVMLTGRQRQHDVTTAQKAGINDFVVKPFSTTSLLKAVTHSLTRKQRFIVSAGFTGPDRRRRRAGLFPGILRRADDGTLRERLSGEADVLRQALLRHERIDPRVLDNLTGRLLEVQTEAHGMRLKLLEQATHSLNEYVRHFGNKAEAEVLDVHLDALIRLNDVPYSEHEEAVNIVSQLNRLVDQRRKRKVS